MGAEDSEIQNIPLGIKINSKDNICANSAIMNDDRRTLLNILSFFINGNIPEPTTKGRKGRR